MEFWKTFLYLFGAIGVINGIVLSVVLFASKTNKLANRLLGALILVICIRIGKSIYFYQVGEADKLILQIGLSACIFIGPLAYMYFKSARRKTNSLSKTDAAILLLCGLWVLGVGILYPYRQFPEVWNSWGIRTIYGVWLVFTALSLYELSGVFAKAVKERAKLDRQEKRLLAILLGYLFISFTYQFALWISGFTYLWGSLIFTSAFYYLIFVELAALLRQRQRKSAKNALLPEDGKAILEKVEQAMKAQKLYRDPALKLPDLEKATGIKAHLLSRVLNEVYPHGFATYVNEKRVGEAQRMLLEDSNLSLEGIGYEAGFNSKSSFYAAFKKISGCTPAEYKNSLHLS